MSQSEGISVTIGPRPAAAAPRGVEPRPGGSRGCHHQRLLLFFLAFLGPEEKKQNLRKRGKVFSGKEKTSRDEILKKKNKKTSPKRVRPRPTRFGAKRGEFGAGAHPKKEGLGGLGPSARPRRDLGGETGILGSSHGPGAKQAQKWGFWVTGTKRGRQGGFGAQKGLNTGDLGRIPRPPAQNEARIWDSGSDARSGRKNGLRKGRFGLKRARPPAQNQLRNRDFWVFHAPPSQFRAESGGILGSARPGAPPVLTPLAHLFLPLILGAISSF